MHKYNINELRQRKATLIDNIDELIASAEDGKFTDDQEAQYNGLNASFKMVQRQLEQAGRHEEIALEEEATETIAGEKAPQGGAQVATGPFSSLGEQLQAIMQANLNPGAVDPETNPLFKVADPSGLNKTVDSEGGFLIQSDISSQLLERTYDQSDVLSRVTRIPISANSNSLVMNGIDQTSRDDGSRWGGVRVYWESEAAQIAGSQPKFDQIELKLKKVMGLCYATEEVLADAAALGAIIDNAFTSELDFSIQDKLFIGSGAGEMLGFMGAKGPLVTVAKEGSQAAGSILAENVVKMYARMPARHRRNSVWLINPDLEPLLMLMTVGDTPIYIPPGGLSGAPYGMLLGRPVLPTEHNAALGSAGDIVFTDLSQYIMIDKGGIQRAVSMHVRFVEGETAFRFTLRVDGQPAWKSALKPKNSNNKVSPFVTLAERA